MKTWKTVLGTPLLVLLGLSLSGLDSSCVAQAQNVTVTVDENVEQQRIEGFGAFGAKKLLWGQPLWDQALVDQMINDLGLTILRMEVPTNLEYVNDNGQKNDKGQWDGKPGTLDLAGFDVDKPVEGHHLPLSPHLSYIKAMHETARKNGEPLQLIASIWSPPPWMKYVNSVSGQDNVWNRLSDGTHALPDYYPEFAEFCEGYVRLVERETGMKVSALSPQNELAFAQTYQSAVYSPQQLARAFRVVGERFEKNGISTELFGPEDVQVFTRIADYVNALGEDASTRQYVGALAIHGYGDDGVQADATGERQWAGTFDLARRYNKPLSLAYRFDFGRFKLGYSSDTGFDAGLIAWLDECDLVLHEVHLEKVAATDPVRDMHTPLDDLLRLPAAFQKKTLLCHYADNYTEYRDIGDYRYLRQNISYPLFSS